ncbi:MAG: aminotransferase class V-fold PLP-dependent enzyme [Chloroflexi bacterium]|nr:aminotransferase class V-fold PLP-dependent enzyme [Chloroflexota bacterium]
MPPNPNLKELFLLDPTVAFLNHGSFGATPRVVFEKYQWWQRELEKQPVEFIARRVTDLLKDARGALGAYVNARGDDLVFVANATAAMNIVARGLNLQPGDEILATDHEYGALDRMWRFLCRKTGAVYKQQKISVPVTTHADFVETFWAGVTPRTRVIFISHITAPTALILPVQEICRRARAAGILTMVDGAHALGQIPLDMQTIGADFYTGNAHKWLCAPKGSAFLYARADAQHLVEPLVVSWGYEAELPSGSKFIDEQEWTGTRDPAAWLATPDAIQFAQEHNWDAVRAECHEILRYAREKITALTELDPICPDSTDWFMQMATFALPPCDDKELKRRLYDEFRVEVPIWKWQDKAWLRVSIQGYNSRADVDRLVKGVGALLGSVSA